MCRRQRRDSARAWLRRGSAVTVQRYAKLYGVDMYTAYADLTALDGSGGQGFECLRARTINRRLNCGNVDQPPLVIRPLSTCCVPKVIGCFGSVQRGWYRSMLLRTDRSGS